MSANSAIMALMITDETATRSNKSQSHQGAGGKHRTQKAIAKKQENCRNAFFPLPQNAISTWHVGVNCWLCGILTETGGHDVTLGDP